MGIKQTIAAIKGNRRKPAAVLPHDVTLIQLPIARLWIATCASCGWESVPMTKEQAADAGNAHEVIQTLQRPRR